VSLVPVRFPSAPDRYEPGNETEFRRQLAVAFQQIGQAGLNAANGVVTLEDGNTTVVVTHGLGVTPDLKDISVTPSEAWGAATQFWKHTPTSTQFTIEVDQDPGQDVDFSWSAFVP
jgi:hypothetical protein